MANRKQTAAKRRAQEDENEVDRGEPVAAIVDIDPASDLGKFSSELAKRFPSRTVKRYVMPARVSECREVFLVEMTSRDEVQAAIMADQFMTDTERRSLKLTDDAERREGIRGSIVGIRRTTSYEHVNEDAADPFMELSDWSTKAWMALNVYWRTLNGVPMEDIGQGLLEARTVGAFASPTGATRASASSGR